MIAYNEHAIPRNLRKTLASSSNSILSPNYNIRIRNYKPSAHLLENNTGPTSKKTLQMSETNSILRFQAMADVSGVTDCHK
jgi:hypothetical protein